MWNCSRVNTTRPPLWEVNIGSGNALMASLKKPLPEILAQIYVVVWRHYATLSSKKYQLHNSGLQGCRYLLDSHFAIWFILVMRHTLCAISYKVMNVALLFKGNSLTLKQMARFLWKSGQSTFHSILRSYSILALMPERHKVWMNTYVLLTFDWPTEIGHVTMLIISSEGNVHPLHICCHE